MIRLLLISAMFFPQLIAQKATGSSIDSNMIKAMKWRNIGPFRGGRSIAVAGHALQPLTFYFGATGGGVWKTTDGGITWLNVSDGYFSSSSVGALEVAPSDPNVIYAGTGESCIRGNISPGDGMYKSVNGGETWTFIGLAETRFISRIAVDPRNPDVVFVAALGHVFGDNKERGIYRTGDGGKSWQLVLFTDSKTGGADIVIDPSNPRIIYASMWEAYRNPWSMSSGGPGSGLYKSTDGGATWKNLSKNSGMPRGVLGKIGVTASPAKAGRIWAMIESENGGVFRSDDAGETWERLNDQRSLRQRAWYYTHIYADPQNEDIVYVLNVQWHKSVDGGKTFRTMPTKHGDHHDLWIDPSDASRMILADDGGAVVSFNGGSSWTDQDLPTAQFYHVITDDQFPYNVYGAQQDNSTIKIPSRTAYWGIEASDWHPVAGGESGYIAVDPLNSNVTYGGSYMGYLTRYDHETKQERMIMVWPDNTIGMGAADSKYRFQWTYPVISSKHSQNVLYVASQFVHRSTDGGHSWETISPDLTRNEKDKQKSSGGPITKDNTGVEFYNTIFTLAESNLEAGTLWVGTDDGRIHLTRDKGVHWTEVTPKEMPEGTLVSMIEASSFDAGTAYVAATRYKLNDFRPMIFRTTDFGKTWTRIVRGITEGSFVRVVREDPNRRGLLFAGTEKGLFASLNDGDDWSKFQLNLPISPIHDIAVHKRERDLIVATHGRSFWILDDLSPLHQLETGKKMTIKLYRPRDAYRTQGFQYEKPGLPLGTNPPNGVFVNYVLDGTLKKDAKLEFLTNDGVRIAAFSNLKDKKGKPFKPSEEFYEKPGPTRMDMVPADSGLNRFVWDMRYEDAAEVDGAILWGGSVKGPRVKPGNYLVRLSVDDKVWTESFVILKDPRVESAPADLELQERVLLDIRTQVDSVHKTVIRIRELVKQVGMAAERIKDTIVLREFKTISKPFLDSLGRLEDQLIEKRLKSGQDVLNYGVKLNNRFTMLASLIEASDYAPTLSQIQLLEVLKVLAAGLFRDFDALKTAEIYKLNQWIVERKIPAFDLSGD